jgi:8-oxo-dGTP pyrophosphatase MutT (NUDIX family)
MLAQTKLASTMPDAALRQLEPLGAVREVAEEVGLQVAVEGLVDVYEVISPAAGPSPGSSGRAPPRWRRPAGWSAPGSGRST